jgi:addiction module RelB/DinJ family antitoxin
MTLVTRSATIQVRVMPLVKAASERVLWRIGLNMSEAIELFLRRMIVDERIPFDVVALQTFQIDGFSGERPNDDSLTGETRVGSLPSDVGASEASKTRHRRTKEFKKFSGARTPTQIRTKTVSKKPRTNDIFVGRLYTAQPRLTGVVFQGYIRQPV